MFINKISTCISSVCVFVTFIFILYLYYKNEFVMGLNIKKLKKQQRRFDSHARKEVMENIKDNIISVVLDNDFQEIFRKQKSRQIAETSKRVISHWVKKGLINAEQSSEGSWYYFTRIETVWIEIITQLRKFGVDLKKIKSIRSQLFFEKVEGFSLMEFVIMHSILKQPYLMLVYQDGSIQLLTSTLYSKCIADESLPPHITFNFFHLAKEIYINNNFHLGIEKKSKAELTTAEMKLLYFIRTGDFSQIKIRLNEDDIFLIEGKKQIKNPKNLMSLISEKAYKDILVKTANGKVAYISSTEKIKIKATKGQKASA